MRSRDDDVVKRDTEATKYLNESNERTSRQSFDEDLEEFEEDRFGEEDEEEKEVEEEEEQEEEQEKQEQEQQSEEEENEEEEDIGSQEMATENEDEREEEKEDKDEEAESFDADIDVHAAVKSDREIEQQLSGSSSGSWESGDEDERFDAGRQATNVTVLRGTATDIPVSRLRLVPADTDQLLTDTKMSLRGQQQLPRYLNVCLSKANEDQKM